MPLILNVVGTSSAAVTTNDPTLTPRGGNATHVVKETADGFGGIRVVSIKGSVISNATGPVVGKISVVGTGGSVFFEHYFYTPTGQAYPFDLTWPSDDTAPTMTANGDGVNPEEGHPLVVSVTRSSGAGAFTTARIFVGYEMLP